MPELLDKLGSVLLDLSPPALVGAVAIALMLSLAGAGLHRALRSRAAGEMPYAALIGLMTLVSVASMAFAAAYTRPSGPAAVGASPSPVPGPDAWRGRSIVEAMDADRDGRLTPREAVDFVIRADGNRKGYADAFDVDHARGDGAGPRLATWAGRPPGPPPSPFHRGGPSRPLRPEGRPGPVVCYPSSGGATGHELTPIVTWRRPLLPPPG